MKKFKVHATKYSEECCTVEVEAEDEDHAYEVASEVIYDLPIGKWGIKHCDIEINPDTIEKV